MTIPVTLTPEEFQALALYAANYGRKWKSRLTQAWLGDWPEQRGILNTIHNTHGSDETFRAFARLALEATASRYKTCTRCGESKQSAEFYRDRTRRAAHCKVCDDARDRPYNAAYFAAYHKANKAKRHAQGKAWREANPGAVRNSGKRYRERHRADLNAWRREDRKSNPEKYKESTARPSRDLTYSYVRSLLQHSTEIPASRVPATLIEAKRAQLQLKRLIKEKSA